MQLFREFAINNFFFSYYQILNAMICYQSIPQTKILNNNSLKGPKLTNYESGFKFYESLYKQVNCNKITAPILANNFFQSNRQIHSVIGETVYQQRRLFHSPAQKEFIKTEDYKVKIKDFPIKQFNADLIGGNLIILPCESGEASMRVQWDGPQSDMPLFYSNGNVLHLKTTNFQPLFTQKNAYIIEIYLPEEVDINVSMLAGTLYLGKTKGNLKINMFAGDISGNTSSKVASVKLGFGDIKLHHLRGSIKAGVIAGSVQLLFDKINHGDYVDLSCYWGDIKARFPAGFLPSIQTYKEKGHVYNLTGASVFVNNIIGGIKIDMSDPLENDIVNVFRGKR